MLPSHLLREQACTSVISSGEAQTRVYLVDSPDEDMRASGRVRSGTAHQAQGSPCPHLALPGNLFQWRCGEKDTHDEGQKAADGLY
jgi:hypothetical protein